MGKEGDSPPASVAVTDDRLRRHRRSGMRDPHSRPMGAAAPRPAERVGARCLAAAQNNHFQRRHGKPAATPTLVQRDRRRQIGSDDRIVKAALTAYCTDPIAGRELCQEPGYRLTYSGNNRRTRSRPETPVAPSFACLLSQVDYEAAARSCFQVAAGMKSPARSPRTYHGISRDAQFRIGPRTRDSSCRFAGFRASGEPGRGAAGRPGGGRP